MGKVTPPMDEPPLISCNLPNKKIVPKSTQRNFLMYLFSSSPAKGGAFLKSEMVTLAKHFNFFFSLIL